jgi:hypothetical protein
MVCLLMLVHSESKNSHFQLIQPPWRTFGFHERTGSFLDGYLHFKILRTLVCDFFLKLHSWINPKNWTDNLAGGLFLIFNSQHQLALSTWSPVRITPCWSLLKFWKWPEYGSSLSPSDAADKNFNSCCFGHTASTTTTAPFQNKAIQGSGEIESDIESYGERKYNIYLPNCIKLPRILLVYLEISIFQNASHQFCPPPRYLAGTCVPTSYCRNPYTLITLDDTQTQNKEFPVVAIFLQWCLETFFWKGA